VSTIASQVGAPAVVSTRRMIAEDLRMSGGRGVAGVLRTVFFNPAFQLLVTYRVSNALYRHGLRWPLAILKYAQYLAFHCQIAPNAVLGRRVKFAHPLGVVIGEGVTIGNDCVIYQHVTFGSHGRKQDRQAYPVLADGVTVFAGAVIVGNVRLGAQSVIGANAVVLRDVPAGATAAGNPARIIGGAREPSDTLV
jgi:serine O-acetyltransferase